MSPLRIYEEKLARDLKLPSWKCVYTPNVYWKLTKEQKDTLNQLRKSGC